MVETIQLAGDECAVAQFGVTPSESMPIYSHIDWDKVDSLMMRVLMAAENVAKYQHAQLSAIKLSG
jgi:hypothetical protein